MESLRFAEVFAPAPPVTSMSMKTGPAACRNRKATSWNCSGNWPTSEMPLLACRAKSISPRHCRVSRWPSPRIRDAAQSFLLGLPAYGLLRRCDGLLVAEESAAERLQLLVQFVEHRYTGRDIELHDVALGHHVEHLDQGAQ